MGAALGAALRQLSKFGIPGESSVRAFRRKVLAKLGASNPPSPSGKIRAVLEVRKYPQIRSISLRNRAFLPITPSQIEFPTSLREAPDRLI